MNFWKCDSCASITSIGFQGRLLGNLQAINKQEFVKFGNASFQQCSLIVSFDEGWTCSYLKPFVVTIRDTAEFII